MSTTMEYHYLTSVFNIDCWSQARHSIRKINIQNRGCVLDRGIGTCSIRTYVIRRQRDSAEVRSTRTMAGSTVYCTDYKLIRVKVAICITPKHWKQHTSRRRINVGKLTDLSAGNKFKRILKIMAALES